MTMRGILLASAAALTAVSGARAADAVVVAEPEPMEYVRVCDVYGAGFYYIPGTETCLRVGGYLRYDIGVGDRPSYGAGYGGLNDINDKMGDGLNDTYYKRARAAIQLDARSETELGTLRAYMHLNFDWDSRIVGRADGETTGGDSFAGGTTAKMNHAYIELGGFRVGKTDSMFTTLVNNLYAGDVIADDMLGGYGPWDTHQISYTYTGANGFSAAVALEEGTEDYTLDDYIPHVVVGAAYTQGWGGVSGVVGYDSVYEEWAGKVRLDVKATETINLWVMAGYGSDDNVTRSWYKTWGGNWAVWGGGSAKLNEKATFNLQASYFENEDVTVAANVAYELVPGLKITPEVTYFSAHTDDKVKIDDGVGGFLRFQRNF
ncbi:porin [Mesorhizobium sp. CGMCC 1.15528]|uniref:Porin n=1 Tax=Mesorhizobium zhangyense TaxID=1776730 RepID=A0A7C9R951_9HYPH|nr:porin [Mesorhizobium zhangyense]NGN43137.1 porin [Mesorhizobium zhangyense]